ncbi:hypothetical protein ABIB60_003734 [Hymenobacter sp. UYP22]
MQVNIRTPLFTYYRVQSTPISPTLIYTLNYTYNCTRFTTR